jgi:hypothetical protein
VKIDEGNRGTGGWAEGRDGGGKGGCAVEEGWKGEVIEDGGALREAELSLVR